MKFILKICLVMALISSCSAKKEYMLVGTYTSGKSTGIYVYEFNAENKTAKLVDSIKTSNPSFLAISPDEKYVYAVNEDDAGTGGGRVTAFSFDKKNGDIKELNQQAT